MPSAAAVRPESVGSSATVDSIVQHIDKMIGQGFLKPGDSLSEPTLIATLGVGRVPVREAIRLLAGEGVLELVQNRSARVRPVDSVEVLEMLDVLTGFSVTAMHLLSLKPMQPAIAETLQLSAARIGKLAKAGSSSNDMMHEISRFHFILIKASENLYLLRLLRKTRLNYYSRNVIALLGHRAFVEVAPRYSRLADALVRGDPQAAIRILLRSVERSKSYAKID